MTRPKGAELACDVLSPSRARHSDCWSPADNVEDKANKAMPCATSAGKAVSSSIGRGIEGRESTSIVQDESGNVTSLRLPSRTEI